ncbi:interleukin-10 receptor subunit alpha isoform X1 [Strix uralensis]|uniref:interleukin-10 receptor subunit alpha isoform X1 n=1 Tax=Strix uralensis TaxID=36305 RepID=UPI003DA773BD
MAPSATALALCVALFLTRRTDGEMLEGPTDVRFVAEIAHHLLRWEPGHNARSDVRYEVEHRVYGTNFSWMATPNCRNISELSCDLTYYTLDPALRYYARVRAVARNHTSPWQRTNSFSPREASLRLSGQSLSLTGNTIHVQLQLLLRAGNLTVKYDDVQKHTRRYWVYVRRAQDNRTYKVLKTTPEFNITNLFWDTEYCISVEPDVASRRIHATRTDEHCVAIGGRDSKWRGSQGRGGLVGCGSWGAGVRTRVAAPCCRCRAFMPCALGTLPAPSHPGTSSLAGSAELVLSIVSSSFITLLLLGLLGALLVCTYIKKPVRPPSVLKSFIKQSSLWMEQESSSSGSPDADPIQQLFLCQKEPQQDSSPCGSAGTAQLPLEKGWRLPAWPEDQLCLLGPGAVGRGDSSCTSTDSGICLHTSSSELSCSSSPEPQGYKRQLPTGDDSGVGLENICPGPTGSSSSGTASPAVAGQPCGGEFGLSPAAGQDVQQAVEFRGYLQQSKGTVEPRQDPARGVPFSGCAGSPQGPGSTDIVLDFECSELAVAKGYLKQSSPEHPHSHAQDLPPWGAPQEPTAWDLSSPVGPRATTLLSYGAPGAPLASKVSPELLKAPFDLSIFNTDILETLPLISSLSTNKWHTLQINALSLLNGDSKDSRL